MTRTRNRLVPALGAALMGALLTVGATPPAHALSMKECSAKYKAAKQDGTLGGANWKAFRASQCASATSAASPANTATTTIGTGAATGAATTGAAGTGAASAAPPPSDATSSGGGSHGTSSGGSHGTSSGGSHGTSSSSAHGASGASQTASGPATFPSAIDPKYAKETPGKGRMHTCLDQYHANKSGNGNGGMRWIQKGGGYYSACSKKLKG